MAFDLERIEGSHLAPGNAPYSFVHRGSRRNTSNQFGWRRHPGALWKRSVHDIRRLEDQRHALDLNVERDEMLTSARPSQSRVSRGKHQHRKRRLLKSGPRFGREGLTRIERARCRTQATRTCTEGDQKPAGESHRDNVAPRWDFHTGTRSPIEGCGGLRATSEGCGPTRGRAYLGVTSCLGFECSLKPSVWVT